MKTFSIAISLLFCITLSSCHKLKKGALTEIEGDYHWSYTKHDEITYTTNAETTDQYGARISSKNQLLLFKNGAEIGRYKIVRYTPNANGHVSNLQLKTNEFNNIVYSCGDTLKVQHFPFDDSTLLNYFIKTH
jgi:hypothetical protein